MKGTSIFSCKFLAILCLSCFTMQMMGQGKTLDKTYSWNYKVASDVVLTINNYDCDLIIHSGETDEVKYKLTINAKMNSEEEVVVLNQYLNSLNENQKTGSLEINSRFWKNRKTIGSKMTMTLRNGKKVKCKDFAIKGELWIPIDCRLNLNSKYSVIDMEDLSGNTSLVLYNDKLFGGKMDGSTSIEAKYSTLEFTEMNDINATFYNTDIDVARIGKLTIASKYSNFRATTAGAIKIDSYSDKFWFANTGDIKFTNKYSHLNAGKVGNIILDGYTSTLTVAAAEKVDVTSKYGNYEIGQATQLRVSSSYSDSYKFNNPLNSVDIVTSKYGNYQLARLNQSFSLKEGYSDKIKISSTGNGFKGIEVDGKYVNTQVALDDGISYRFACDVKYPKFDINEENLTPLVRIEEGSHLEMKAIKGTEAEGMPEISVRGYNMSLTLAEKL